MRRPTPQAMPASARSRRRLVLAALAALALGAGLGCGDSPTGPRTVRDGAGRLRVHAAVSATITTMVVEVTAPDLAAPLAFNLTIANGQATGTIAVPAGANRTMTVRAFDQRTETHRGARTVTIVEGTNAPLTITLLPLAGDQPITVLFGTTLVVVTPATATRAVGDTLRLGAVITDVDGNPVAGRVRWATLDPRRATVDTLGLVTFRDTGSVQVIATYGTVGGASALRGTPAVVTPVAILRRWVGGAAGAPRDWQTANNWDPATIPAAGDSVVIPASAAANPPLLRAAAQVRDLVVEAGASLATGGFALVVTGALDVEGTVTGTLSARDGARLGGTLPALDVRGTVTVARRTSTTGTMLVTGPGSTLRLAAQRLTVGGTLTVNGGATLTMDQAADTLETLADASINPDAGDHTGRLVAGTWLVRGANLFGSRLLAGGTHRLVMAGTTPQSLFSFDYLSRADNGVQELEIRNQVTLCGHLRAFGAVRVAAPVAFTQGCGGYQLRADGEVTTVAGSTVSVYLVDLRAPGGTGGVLGAWRPTYTDFAAVGQAIRGGLGYEFLRFFRSQQLTAPVTATAGISIDGAGTTLDVNGQRLRSQAGLSLTNGATLTMDGALDTVDVRGALNMDGGADHTGRLTAGAIRAGGNVSGGSIGAGGTFRLILDGTGPVQQLFSFDYLNRPANALQDLTVANTNGVQLCGHVRVRGTFDLAAPVAVVQGCGGYQVRVDGELRTVAGSTVSSYLFSLGNASGTSNVLGTWAPDFTDFTLPGQPVNPALGYRTLRAFQAVTFTGNTRITGELYADGAATAVTLGGHRVDVGRLNVVNGATLVMRDPADTLWDAGDMVMTGGAQAGRLTAGVLAVGGNLNGTSFSSGGTHKLLLMGQGTRQQMVAFDFPRPIQQLEVANAAGVQLCTHMQVTGDAVVATPVTLAGDCGGYTMQVRGVLRTVAGSNVAAYRVQLDNAAGTTQVLGAFAPAFLALNAPAIALRPGLAYRSVEVYQALTLPDSMTVAGDLTVSGNAGSLTLGGRRLAVTGFFNTDAGGTVNMTDPADSLVVAGGMFLDGGADHAARFTAGTIVWTGTGGNWTDYRGSGTHRLVLAGTGGVAQQLNTGSAVFRHVRVSGSAPVGFNCGAFVTGTFDVTGASTVTGCGTLVLAGPLTTSEASVFRPDGVELRDASGTANVNGTFAATNTRFNAVAPVVRPGLGYGNVFFSTSATFSGPTNVGGILQVDGNGAVLSAGGNRITVGNYLNADGTAVFAMTNPADTVRVVGDVYLDGGDETGYLTAGVLHVSGQTLQGTALRAGGTHRVVLDGAAGAPTNVNGAPVFRALDLAGLRGANFNCDVTVADTLRVLASAPLTGCGTTRVGGPFSSVAGSNVTVNRLQLEHPSGTGLVAGAFAPATTVLTAANPVLAPALAYRALELTRPTVVTGPMTLAGNLTVSGAGTTLTLGGHRVSVGGFFTIGGGATLVSTQAADTLEVRGPYAQFQSTVGDEAGLMTAGALLVAGDLYLEGDGVDMSGTHRVAFTGTGTGTQTIFSSTPARPLQDVRVEGTRSLAATNLTVRGTFAVTTAAPVTVSSAGTWQLGGAATAPATAAWALGTVQLDAPASIAGVAGPWTATLSQFAGVAQAIPTAANFTYRNVEVRGGDVRLDGAALFNGSLAVYGQLTVGATGVADATGAVSLLTGGTLVNNLGGQVRFGTTFTAQAGSTLLGAAPVLR